MASKVRGGYGGECAEYEVDSSDGTPTLRHFGLDCPGLSACDICQGRAWRQLGGGSGRSSRQLAEAERVADARAERIDRARRRESAAASAAAAASSGAIRCSGRWPGRKPWR